MRNKEETFKSFILISITMVYGFIADLLIVLILTRLYIPEEYALYQFSLSFLAYFTIFANFGLSFMITHYLSAEKDSSRKKLTGYISEGFKWLFLLTIIFSIILFAIADLFESLYNMPGLGIVLKFTALYLFGINVTNYFESVFQGLWKFKLFSLSFILGKSSKLIVVLICFFNGLQIVYVIMLIAITSIVQMGVIIIFQIKNKNLNQVFRFESGLTKEIFKYSVYIFLYIILLNIITSFNQFILALYVSSADLAYFTMILWIINNLSILSIIFSRFAMPYISHYIKSDDLEAKKNVEMAYNLIIKYGLLIVIPVSFYFFFFSDYLIVLLFGSIYSPISHYLKIYIFYLNINILDVTGGFFLWASKQTKTVYKLFIITALCTISLSIILIPFLLIYGAIIAVIIPHSIYVLYSNYLVKKQNNLTFESNTFLVIIKSIISASLILVLLYGINLIFQFDLNIISILAFFTSVFFVLFFVLSLLLKAVSVSEIKSLIQTIKESIF